MTPSLLSYDEAARWFDRIHDSGNWFPFYRQFFLILPKLTGLFLQDLINRARFARRDGRWFLCSSSFLEDEGWTVDEQDNHLDRLRYKPRERGTKGPKKPMKNPFVEIERRGSPPRRWVLIRWDCIHRALDKVVATDANTNPGNVPSSMTAHVPSSMTAHVPSSLKRNNRENKAARPKAAVQTPSNPLPNGDRSMQPEEALIPCTAPAKKGTPSPFDLKAAQQLRDGLISRHKQGTPWSKRGWANQIRLLREGLGDAAEERISSALEWYLAHLGDDYLPVAFSAAGFREKFDRIESAKSRHEKRNPAPVQPDESTRFILDQLAMAGGPVCSEHLPAAVQKSLDSLRAFALKVEGLQKTLDRKSDLFSFIQRIHHELNVDHIVQHWFEDVARRLKKWKDWHGSIMDFVIRADHPEFAKMGQRWSMEYCGDGSYWNRLVGACNAVV
jgi:hypothetical protein